MATVLPLVRHPTRGFATNINPGDSLEAPSFRVPSGGSDPAVDANGRKIVNVATPTAQTDAATKAYVDTKLSGFVVKEPVRVMSAGAAVAIATAPASIDGVTLAPGDRILLVHQGGAAAPAHVENGIYVFEGAGAPLHRAEDADGTGPDAELRSGVTVHVREGSATRANTTWVLTSPDTPIVIGTTAIQFTQFSSVADIIAGTALSKNGNTLSVLLGTTSSTAAAGNHTHTIIAGDGLTGGGSVANGASVALNVGAGSGIIVAADTVSVNFPPSGGTNGTLAQAARSDHTHDPGDVGAVPTTRNLIAGNGLTGGGTLAADRTFNVGAGNGITVSADAVSVDGDGARGIGVDSVGVYVKAGAGLEFDGTTGDLKVKPGVGLRNSGAFVEVFFSPQTLYADPLAGGALQVAGIQPDGWPASRQWNIGDDVTNVTALELEELTDGSVTDLHRHDHVFRVIDELTAGENLDQGDVIAVKSSDGKAYKARADDEDLANVLGLALTPAPIGAPVQVVVAGLSGGGTQVNILPVGEYFLGATGGLVAVPPSGVDDRIVRVGYMRQGATLKGFVVAIQDFGAL